jgi:hypothetical protein
MLARGTRALSAILLSTCALSNCSPVSPGSKDSTPSETAKSTNVRVGISDTKAAFDDDLLITLTRTNHENSQWKVSATIRSPNHDSFKIEDQGIDFSTSYRGKNYYTIHILSADYLQATFLVIRSEVTPEATQPSGDNWFLIKVNESKTAVLFNNDLSIKLINIQGEGAQRKVSLIISSSRHDEHKIEGAGIDFSISFSGQDSYVIHLVDIGDKRAGGDIAASFIITRGKNS